MSALLPRHSTASYSDPYGDIVQQHRRLYPACELAGWGWAVPRLLHAVFHSSYLRLRMLALAHTRLQCHGGNRLATKPQLRAPKTLCAPVPQLVRGLNVRETTIASSCLNTPNLSLARVDTPRIEPRANFFRRVRYHASPSASGDRATRRSETTTCRTNTAAAYRLLVDNCSRPRE